MPDISVSPHVESQLHNLEIYGCYKKSKYLSIKHSSYFQVYEELLSKYRGTKITFVEIGVLNGGSLFMWRDYFGPKARIIGIDLNPIAKKWENDGFEIFIGSQADPDFWGNFFSAIGDVDIILDDGGHTNEQQIITAHHCIPHIQDNGMLIVEDTHTSYMKRFGNPSKYSFINYTKKLIDAINSRFPSVRTSNNILKNVVYSIGVYESIVCFNINRSKCFISSPTSNEGISINAKDFREHESSSSKASILLSKSFKKMGIKFSARKFFNFFEIKYIAYKNKKYFY